MGLPLEWRVACHAVGKKREGKINTKIEGVRGEEKRGR